LARVSDDQTRAETEIPLRTFVAIAFALLLSVSAEPHAQEQAMIADAQASAKSWLALTDAAAYAQSWDQAAAVFQAAVPKTGWINALESIRSPLGAAKSRTLKAASFTRTLPGAPDGEYVVIQYVTQFERKADALETVTPLREKDGAWKVSGYFIK
jgi:hypothetical protein